MAPRVHEGVELLPAATWPASADRLAELDAEGLLLEELGTGGLTRRPLLVRAARLGAWLACALALAPPWLVCALSERLLSAGRSQRCKMAAWWFVSLVFDDALVMVASLRPRSYGRMVYAFPRAFAGSACALTIDDAPGRDPAAFAQLLDILKRERAAVTFFVTSDYVEGLVDDAHTRTCSAGERAAWRAQVRQVMVRALREGHELANHMPADRVYVRECAREPAQFRSELRRRDAVLQALADERGGGRGWRRRGDRGG
jgi:hypothetical protein